MNKTIKEISLNFLKWLFASLITVSGLANLVFWFFIGKAFWYHQSSYLWISLWWLLATIPSAVVKAYSYKEKNKKKYWY